MRTTLDGGVEGHMVAGRRLTDLTLRARSVLPRQRNGRPPAPSDPYARQVRKEMQQGRSCEFQRIHAVLVTDLRDRVPLPLVAAPLRQLLAELEAEHARLVRADERPIVATIRRETRAQATLDLAQIRVVHEPTSPDALTDALRAADQYAATLDDFTGAVVRALVTVEARNETGRRPTEVVRTPLRSRPRVSATSNAPNNTPFPDAAPVGVPSSALSSAMVAGGAR